MTAPKRLIEGGGGELEQALLKSATSDAPSDEARKKAALALGLAGVVAATSALKTAAPTGAAAPGASAATAALGKLVLLAFVVGAAGAVGWMLSHRVPARAVPAIAPAPAPAAAIPAPVPVAPRTAVAPAVAPPGPVAAPAAHRPAHPSVAPRDIPAPGEASATPPAERGSALADEIALVDVAREAMEHKTYGAALRVLAQHARDFPDGVLAPEVAALRVEAMLRQGDESGARVQAQRFLASHPQSPLVERIQRLLAEKPAPR